MRSRVAHRGAIGSSPMGDGERHGPERSIQTGIGALDVRRPKVRDRAADVADEKKIRFL